MIKEGAGRKGKFAIVFLVFLVVCLVFTAWLCQSRMETAALRLHSAWQEKQQVEVERISRQVASWRGELARQINLVTASDTFRIMLSDIARLDKEAFGHFLRRDHKGGEDVSSLIEQADYAASLLDETAKAIRLAESRIFSIDGEQLVAAGIYPPLGEARKGLLEKAVKNGALVFGPIYENNGALFIDCAEPIFGSAGKNTSINGIFSGTIPLDKELPVFLADRSDMSFVVSDRTDGFTVGLRGKHPVFSKALVILDGGMEFGERSNLMNDSLCYSFGLPLNEPAWTVVAETPAKTINDILSVEKLEAWLLGLIISMSLALLGAAIWFFVTRREHERRNAELEAKNRLIGEQKDMLDSLNQSLTAGLALIGSHGEVRAANQSFCKMLGVSEIPQDELLQIVMRGSNWADFSKALSSAKENPVETEMTIGEKLYRLGLYPGKRGDTACVFQDITAFRNASKKRMKRQKALVGALEKAIEAADPNLSGHSGKLGRLVAKMGNIAGMDHDSLDALELAASLSQVGKVFIPRGILVKESQLSEDERAEIAAGLEKGAKLLSDMDFGLPVPEIVASFHAKSPDSREAALLILANAFIAMTSKRKWRKNPLSYGEALEILSSDKTFAAGDIEILKMAVKGDWEN